ncbi:MAG: class II glutamine amidotransferase, partial [Ignavibacteriales bacterium]|nr:class II glutamine amidotransferase [Ignavibacteriales bacterium]
MCGIVGYIGNKNSLPILIEGLRRLEYRGYDSAGVALIRNDKLVVYKQAGKVNELAKLVAVNGLHATVGVGHTRWATHGAPNDVNAHPHGDCNDEIAIIHNGIIENYATLRRKLERDGHVMRTETDTEVIAHLIEEMNKKYNDLFTATRLALLEVQGTYGILVISKKEPDRIIAARKGSPLMLGIGDHENFVASDAAALIDHTRNVIYLADDEIACILKDSYFTKTIHDKEIVKQIEKITFDLEEIEKGGFDHFMLKE